MPFIWVEISEGRTIDQRRRFAEEVTRAAVECLGAESHKVRIRFAEIKPQDLARDGVLVLDEQTVPVAADGGPTPGTHS